MIKNGLSINSAKLYVSSITSFFAYCGESIKVEGIKAEKKQVTYIPTIEELRRMYTIADLRGKVILSLGLDLGWRVGDFITIKKADIPDLNGECPLPIQKTTQKESELSCTFISCETVALLKEYMPNLPTDNEYLFPNRTGGFVEDFLVNGIIQDLATKIHMNIPKGKKFSFHAFRKRVLSTAVTLGIDDEVRCLLVGKAIDASHEVYYGDAKLQDAFLRIRKELSLNGNGNGKVSKLSEDMVNLQTKVETLEKENKYLSNTLKNALTVLAAKDRDLKKFIDNWEGIDHKEEREKEEVD